MVTQFADLSRCGREFELAMASDSSESRKTQTLRCVPVPSGYAPASPLRASASRYRRLTDKNPAALSADTKASGALGGEFPESRQAFSVMFSFSFIFRYVLAPVLLQDLAPFLVI